MKHFNANLRSIRKGQVKDLERKIGPASSARSSSKGLKDNNNRLVSIVNKFCISICTESTISICGWLDSDCTVVTLRRVANFRVKHLKSDIERTRRGITKLLILLILLAFYIPTPFFCLPACTALTSHRLASESSY